MILKLVLADGDRSLIEKENKHRRIISHFISHSKNDAYNRKRGIAKPEKALNCGKLNKRYINNKGYNKFVKFEGAYSLIEKSREATMSFRAFR